MCIDDHRIKISREVKKLSSSDDILTGWSGDGRVNTGEYHWSLSILRQMLRCLPDYPVSGFYDYRTNFSREEYKPASNRVVLTRWSGVALV